MYLKARIVYLDCKYAHRELDDQLVGDLWRRRWIAFITLLRTIGYVLKKVDSERWNGLKPIIEDEWRSYKDDTIFKEFIDKEKNLVQKEYEFNAVQNVEINLNCTPPQPKIDYSIKSGFYKDKDPRLIGEQALSWWDNKLSNIERRYQEIQVAR